MKKINTTIRLLGFLLILPNLANAQTNQHEEQTLVIFFTNKKNNNYKNPKNYCAYFYIENNKKAKYMEWTSCGKLTESIYYSVTKSGDTVVLKNPTTDRITHKRGKDAKIIINNGSLESEFFDPHSFKYYKIIEDSSFDISKVDFSRRKFRCMLTCIFPPYKNHEQTFQKLE